MTGTIHIWIKDYAKTIHSLVNLTCENVPFIWKDKEQHAMDELKVTVVNCSAIQPIDYMSGQSVTLAIDSFYIMVGYILFQDNKDGRHWPS